MVIFQISFDVVKTIPLMWTVVRELFHFDSDQGSILTLSPDGPIFPCGPLSPGNPLGPGHPTAPGAPCGPLYPLGPGTPG